MQSPYGEVVDPPEDFVHPEQWPEYGALYRPVGICAREEVGKHPRGIRWSLWPFTFEEYVGDTEPVVQDAQEGKLARFRIVVWKRLRPAPQPRGWFRMSRRPWSLDAFCRLGPEEDYTKQWSHRGRRNLRRWQKASADYAIEDISFDAYKEAYKKGTARREIGMERLHSMERALAVPAARENLHLWVVRNKRTGMIAAGLGAIYSPAHRASMYHIPFLLSEGKKTCAMTGLVDHWFAHAQKSGIRMQVFTDFWQPGAPRGWKGPSEFKARFTTHLVAYPPSLWRFVPGKIF